ncbi:MAG: hypothetical protein MAG794_00543 [Gammaproteobacteria bacterium]|nr:hypothetical protein [Gammaproteobacteria bacterium]
MKRRTLLIAITASTLLTACGRPAEAKAKVIVYKSASCGCCSGWVEHMKNAGYDVETHNVSNLPDIKKKYHIPSTVESCHTAVIGDYVIEGHVPSEVVGRLLAQRPKLDAIALPRMPAGSPGMPGSKNGTWTIYAITDGKLSVFEKL